MLPASFSRKAHANVRTVPVCLFSPLQTPHSLLQTTHSYHSLLQITQSSPNAVVTKLAAAASFPMAE